MKTKADDIYDEMLVLRCQSGDESALPILINRWQDILLRHIRVVSGQSDAAMDILQESWIAVFKGLKRLRDPSLFKYWLYRIVNNKCIDFARKPSFKLDPEVDVDQQLHTAPTDNIEQQAQQLIAALPATQRVVMALHYLHGFDIREIAHITQLPEGTVKSRLHHGREKFKTIIENRD